jgi:hypothetical protein
MTNRARIIARGHDIGERIPREFFSIHFASLNGWLGYTTPFLDIGQGAIRLWDTGTSGRTIINESNVYNYSRLDALVSIAESHNQEITLTLGSLPLFMTGGVGPATGSYNPTPPTNIQYWIDYCTSVMSRYAGRIHKYETWNEFDLAQFWTGTVEQLSELTLALCNVRNTIDPNAKILSASVSTFANSKAEAYYASAVDEVATHMYVQPREPEICAAIARSIKGSMRGNIINHPIVSTEGTWNNYYNAGTLVSGDNNPMPDALAAAYVVRKFVSGRLGGASQISFYGVDNFGFNNIRILDQSTKSIIQPAGIALQHLIALLVNGYIWGDPNDATFITSDGKIGRYLCSADNTTRTVDLSSYASGVDVLGNPIVLSNNYTVTMSPIFVLNSKNAGLLFNGFWKDVGVWLDTNVWRD